MTSKEFIIWFKGFAEACHEFHPTPKQWDRIKEVLDEVQDYDDNPGWVQYPITWVQSPITLGTTDQSIMPSGSISSNSSITFTTSSITPGYCCTTIWNDKMGNWHYTNYPEGFGYYTNSTLDKITPEETKKQLID